MIGRVSAAFALAWAATSMVVGPGGAAFVRLAGNEAAAGVFVALFYVGAAVGGWGGGHLMDRVGRRPVVVAGYVLGATGYIVAGWAQHAGALAAFVAGTLLLAAASGALTLGRLAVAEAVEPARRGRALAILQASATAGAVVGPLLLIAAPRLPIPAGSSPLDVVWWVAPPLLLAGAALVGTGPAWPRWTAPGPVATQPGSSALWPAVATLVLVQAAMVAVMAVAGPVVLHAGHGADAIGAVVLLHFAGMFGLSLLIGRVADRRGRPFTIACGWTLLAVGGATVAFLPGLPGFAVGLMLVGFGWSFAYLGGTAMFADRAPPQSRARLLGRIDLAASLLAAATAAGAGVLFARHGLLALGLAAVAIALCGGLVLAAVGMPWRRRSPGEG
ncbi:MAG: MFS transporter [Halobacteriales archaeon]|nr:MFS transporter [Halobacteriales archaeon]